MFRKAVLSILFHNLILLMNVIMSYSMTPIGNNHMLKLNRWEHLSHEGKPYMEIPSLEIKQKNQTHWSVDGIIRIRSTDMDRYDFTIRMLTINQDVPIDAADDTAYLCDELDQYDGDDKDDNHYYLQDMLKFLNVTNIHCPIPEGDYALNSFELDTRNLPVYVEGKKWMFKILFREKGGIITGGLHVFAEIEKV
ncbi:uncharacterized protein LOC123300869 isoform X2 [Chrysoperla carnea]|uniref:uncharacterized protein LOC123300869 isoform X2 n=1 Tax=Chrysoperla carnea TaxID=189513 RepID=UPI001D05E22F|nr:uncharacterized protein LOC123300869 isoform X2 [Chrysoperla carnea]